MGLDGQLIGKDSEEFSDLEEKLVEELNRSVGIRLPIGQLYGQAYFERIGRYSDLQRLRSYAAHIAVFKKSPESLDAEPISEELRTMYDGSRPFSHPHLMNHSDCEGYYVPTPFSEPVQIPLLVAIDSDSHHSEEVWHADVGSSAILLRELESMSEFLHLPNAARHRRRSKPLLEALEGDLWAGIKWAWTVLYWLAQESVERNVLVMFS
jgi:hypothetical protein